MLIFCQGRQATVQALVQICASQTSDARKIELQQLPVLLYAKLWDAPQAGVWQVNKIYRHFALKRTAA
jgi:hypothetical protein